MTGAKFKQLRSQIGITQDELAKRWGLHRETIIRIESAKTVPARYRRLIEAEVSNGKN